MPPKQAKMSTKADKSKQKKVRRPAAIWTRVSCHDFVCTDCRGQDFWAEEQEQVKEGATVSARVAFLSGLDLIPTATIRFTCCISLVDQTLWFLRCHLHSIPDLSKLLKSRSRMMHSSAKQKNS
jgi:hypothetical protein